MENERILVLRLELTQKRCLFALTLAFLCFQPRFIGSETLTLTTYYPAPYGGYVSLLTTQRTLLARDGGYVGIGLPNPSEKLDVAGNVKIMGNVKIVDGNQGNGKILISDANGKANWLTLSAYIETREWQSNSTDRSRKWKKLGSKGKVTCSTGCVRTGCNSTCRGTWNESDTKPVEGEASCQIGPNDRCNGSYPDIKIFATCLCIN